MQQCLLCCPDAAQYALYDSATLYCMTMSITLLPVNKHSIGSYDVSNYKKIRKLLALLQCTRP